MSTSHREIDHSNQPFGPWLPVTLRSIAPMNEDAFLRFATLNPEFHFEQTKNGELIVMSPTGGESSSRNAEIAFQLQAWCRAYGGVAFDSSGMFVLPSGAMLSPDASWISQARWTALNAAQRRRFPPLCPDFVVELRSESDRLSSLIDKMSQWVVEGARLAWLVDPFERELHIYRPGIAPQVLSEAEVVSGEPELPGFELKLRLLYANP